MTTAGKAKILWPHFTVQLVNTCAEF